jgi:uncharacterized cupredoxin-like copper-binding protein
VTRSSFLDAAVTILFVAAAAAMLTLMATRTGVAGQRVEIRIRYSHFEPAALVVPRGVPVTFVLRNDDPIEHEWMIGDASMHQAHRTGTEPHHASRPTEVSIPALATIETTVTFADRVTWSYICHLPGHEAFGMVGLLEAR